MDETKPETVTGTEPEKKGKIRSFFGRLKLARFKKPGKHMFWAWIAYQCIKGTLTTSLIWIPLIYAWFHHHS